MSKTFHWKSAAFINRKLLTCSLRWWKVSQSNSKCEKVIGELFSDDASSIWVNDFSWDSPRFESDSSLCAFGFSKYYLLKYRTRYLIAINFSIRISRSSFFYLESLASFRYLLREKSMRRATISEFMMRITLELRGFCWKWLENLREHWWFDGSHIIGAVFSTQNFIYSPETSSECWVKMIFYRVVSSE